MPSKAWNNENGDLERNGDQTTEKCSWGDLYTQMGIHVAEVGTQKWTNILTKSL